jgi:hypothetical protein
MLSSFDVLLIIKSASDFNHDLSLSFLYYKVGKNKLANMQHSIACCLPTINLFTAIFSHLIRSVFSKTSTKCVKEPFHKGFICCSDSNKGLIMFVSILPVTAVISDVESSFSIHDSSHVCGLSNRVFFSDVVRSSRHLISMINVHAIIYNRKGIKCIAAETNPDGIRKNEVIVRASWKHEEVDRNDLLAA